MKKENRKIFIVLILIFLTLVFASVMTFISCDKVYADAYSDTAIVNFNQYIENNYVNNYTLNYETSTIISNLSANSGDVFYLYLDFTLNNGDFILNFRYNDDSTETIVYASNYTSPIYKLITINKNLSNVYYYSNAQNQKINNIILINLTQMFGSNDLVPTLEQCQQIFTSPYYYYNEGTPLYLNGINAYNDGMNAVLDSLRVNVNDYVIGFSSFPYANDSIKRGEFAYDSTINHYTFSGVLGVILITDIKAGTNVNANFELWIPDIQGENDNYAYSFKLNFGYVLNNNLVPLIEITANKRNNTSLFYEGTFNMPIDTNTLYLWVDYSTSDSETPTQIIAVNSELTYRTLETTSLLASQYTKGFNDAKREYEPGGQLYQNIYNLGFAAGSNNSANGSIFTDGWQWLGTMFHSLGEILNIQFLPGLSIGIFVALPLLVGLVSFILKITKGSGD